MNRLSLAQTLVLIAALFVVGTVVSRVRGRTMAEALRVNAATAALFGVCALALFSVAGVAR